MSKQRPTIQDIPIVLDLGDSELLRQAGWKQPTTFSWYVDYDNPEKPYIGITNEHDKEDIVAAAPTAAELFSALPASYQGLYVRLNKWDQSSAIVLAIVLMMVPHNFCRMQAR